MEYPFGWRSPATSEEWMLSVDLLNCFFNKQLPISMFHISMTSRYLSTKRARDLFSQIDTLSGEMEPMVGLFSHLSSGVLSELLS